MQEYRAMGDLTPQEYECVPPYLRERVVCVHCGEDYCEYEHVGRLVCALHPGILVRQHGGQDWQYTCCGYVHLDNAPRDLQQRRGCVLADHCAREDLSTTDGATRLAQLRDWAVLPLPSALFAFGVEVPCHAHTLVRRVDRAPPRQSPPYSVTLTGGLGARQLSHQEVAQVLMRAMEAWPALVQVVSRRDQQSEQRRAAARQAGRLWPREPGQNAEEDALADVRARFVPYVVIRRVAPRFQQQ